MLGENTGVIKLFGYECGGQVFPIHTAHMVYALFGDEKLAKSVNRKRKEKTELLCRAVKAMFVEQLEDRKVSKTGKFTHEADAITFCVAILKMLGVQIRGISEGWIDREGFRDLLEDPKSSKPKLSKKTSS